MKSSEAYHDNQTTGKDNITPTLQKDECGFCASYDSLGLINTPRMGLTKAHSIAIEGLRIRENWIIKAQP